MGAKINQIAPFQVPKLIVMQVAGCAVCCLRSVYYKQLV